MIFYKHFIGDYQRKTNRLSILEDGVYRRLLDEYYANEEPLPLENDECFRLVRAIKPDERKAVLKILSLYFIKTPHGYTQERADEEIVDFKGKSEKASRSAKKRWGANAHANASETHMRPHKQLVPSERNASGDASHSQTLEATAKSQNLEGSSRSVVKEKKQKTSLNPTDRPTKEGHLKASAKSLETNSLAFPSAPKEGSCWPANRYKPTLKDARELQDIMLRATNRAETDETTLSWLKATRSAGSFTRVKQVLELKLSKHRPANNAWFQAVLKDQFGVSPAEAEDQKKVLQERLREAIMIPDHTQRTVACSRCLEEAEEHGIELVGNPFA